jgi:RimJ/RimL family protein N-acetyltransferase
VIEFTTAKTSEDLQGILDLQAANLALNLSAEELQSQGFVTVVHPFETLQKMNEIAPHVIAKSGGRVIAYLLAMTEASQNDLPILRPMFEMFKTVVVNSKPVSSYNYMVIGQVCIDKAFRGQGILEECYMVYRQIFRPGYSFAITEIALRNSRSINAHKRIGFEEIHQYIAPDGEEWSIVIWNW